MARFACPFEVDKEFTYAEMSRAMYDWLSRVPTASMTVRGKMRETDQAGLTGCALFLALRVIGICGHRKCGGVHPGSDQTWVGIYGRTSCMRRGPASSFRLLSHISNLPGTNLSLPVHYGYNVGQCACSCCLFFGCVPFSYLFILCRFSYSSQM